MTAEAGLAGDSATIRITRVLCIFFMTYVHVPGMDLHERMPPRLWTAHVLLADLLGRASVPALSLIGGFLAVGAYRRRASWGRYARERLLVLGAPMFTWNCMVLGAGLAILAFTGRVPFALQSFASTGDPSVRMVLDRLVGTEYGSATIALNFLRDLVVCSVLLPVLQRLLERAGAFGLGGLWFAGMTVGFAPLVLRPHILMFFAAGVFLALRAGQLRPTRATAAALAGAVLLPLAAAAWLAPLAGPDSAGVPETATRALMAVAMLAVAAGLGRSRQLGARLARLEPCAYLLFLSHSLSLQALYWMWHEVFGRSLEGAYLAFYIAAPVFAVAAALALNQLLGALPGPLQVLLAGRRTTMPARVFGRHAPAGAPDRNRTCI